MDQMVRELTWEHTLRILPEIQRAENAYWLKVSDIDTDADFAKITAEFNELLEKAIDALYLDTSDRNSKSSLQQIFRARGKFDTHFGIRPTKSILEFIGV
jgi:hypothetical protein